MISVLLLTPMFKILKIQFQRNKNRDIKIFKGWFIAETFSVKVYGPRLSITSSTVQESSDYHFNQRHRILLLFMAHDW